MLLLSKRSDVVSLIRYRDNLNYEIAMEGLQDLPIYNDTVIKVEKPDAKWPGFPKSVSAISSKRMKE